jgi:hypothetical protein
MAHEHVFHLAAAIDEDGIGMLVEEFVGLLGLEVVHKANYRGRREA